MLAFRLGELRADDTNKQGEEDERKNIADRAIGVANDGTEEVLGHEHLDQSGEIDGRGGGGSGDVLLGGASEFLHQHRLRRGIQVVAGTKDIHHQ